MSASGSPSPEPDSDPSDYEYFPQQHGRRRKKSGRKPNNGQFPVEQIIDMRVEDNKLEFHTEWENAGYSWEPVKSFSNLYHPAILEYKHKNEEKFQKCLDLINKRSACCLEENNKSREELEKSTSEGAGLSDEVHYKIVGSATEKTKNEIRSGLSDNSNEEVKYRPRNYHKKDAYGEHDKFSGSFKKKSTDTEDIEDKNDSNVSQLKKFRKTFKKLSRKKLYTPGMDRTRAAVERDKEDNEGEAVKNKHFVLCNAVSSEEQYRAQKLVISQRAVMPNMTHNYAEEVLSSGFNSNTSESNYNRITELSKQKSDTKEDRIKESSLLGDEIKYSNISPLPANLKIVKTDDALKDKYEIKQQSGTSHRNKMLVGSQINSATLESPTENLNKFRKSNNYRKIKSEVKQAKKKKKILIGQCKKLFVASEKLDERRKNDREASSSQNLATKPLVNGLMQLPPTIEPVVSRRSNMEQMDGCYKCEKGAPSNNSNIKKTINSETSAKLDREENQKSLKNGEISKDINITTTISAITFESVSHNNVPTDGTCNIQSENFVTQYEDLLDLHIHEEKVQTSNFIDYQHRNSLNDERQTVHRMSRPDYESDDEMMPYFDTD